MGDFFVPKRKEVFEKIRRRLELYRHHHSEAAARYLDARPNICEQQKQDTLLLRQRWLESKAKKAAKQSKTSRENNNSHSDHRNLVVTKLKRKIDSVNAESSSTATTTTSSTTTASENIFSFEENNLPSSNIKNNQTKNSSSNGVCGGNKHSTGLPSLSVQIVQQISAHCQQDTPQTIHTNVTVSSCYSTDSPHAGSASHSVHTSVQCKQEPSEDGARTSAANSISSSSTHNSNINTGASVEDFGIGIDYDDDIQNFLDSIDKDIDPSLLKLSEFKEIDPKLRKDLDEFKEICDKYQRDSEKSESGNMYGPLTCGSPGLLKGVFPNLDPCGHMGGIFDSSQNMNANHTIPIQTAIPEHTGPAAETLKQMAAQHQHQQSPGFTIKGMDHFSDSLHNGGFSPNYSQLYRSVPNVASAFSFNQSTNHHLSDATHLTSEMAAAMTYGGTKPLTHFPNEQGQQHNSASSLQQLQNQVQSHFKPSLVSPHQMQVTQTQHMQLSHGSHNMKMTQTQQVQMQPSPQQISLSQQQISVSPQQISLSPQQISLSPQQISLSQQQNFSMGQQQMASENMKMQMLEKLRIEQQQQTQQGRLPPQYMGRPPPDYKMHHSVRSQGPYTNTLSSNGNQNPLQTMQNMVNQTYGTVKNEMVGGSSPVQTNNGIISTQVSAMQQQTISATLASNGSNVGNLPQPNQGIRPDFHSQQYMQQPPAYSAVESSTRTQSSSTYSGAVMRNQRPPNVNVGPEGLNISQQRSSSDWSRASLMQSNHAGMRPGVPNNGSNSHGLTQANAMSTHILQYQQPRPPHYAANSSEGSMAAATTNLAQMPQQQMRQSIPGQLRGGPNSSIVPSRSQMTMQHQGMQIYQQMSMHTSSSAYNMGGPTPGTACVSPAGYNMGGPSPGTTLHSGGLSNLQNNGNQPSGFSNQPSASSQDEFLHFLDNPLNSEPMFDSVHSTADDFSLFEDIFNGK